MRQKSGTRESSSERLVKNIRRVTRKQYSSEEKSRIVLDRLRGEFGQGFAHRSAFLRSEGAFGGAAPPRHHSVALAVLPHPAVTAKSSPAMWRQSTITGTAIAATSGRSAPCVTPGMGASGSSSATSSRPCASAMRLTATNSRRTPAAGISGRGRASRQDSASQ